MPPGLGFNAISDKALAASKSAAYRALGLGVDAARQSGGLLPYTPSTNLLWPRVIAMLMEGGLRTSSPATKLRTGHASRREGWGSTCAPESRECSGVLT